MVEAVKAKGRLRGRHKAYINQISLEAKEFTVGGQCITDTQPLNNIAQLKSFLEEQIWEN